MRSKHPDYTIKSKRGKVWTFLQRKCCGPQGKSHSLRCGPTTCLVWALLLPSDLPLAPSSANSTPQATSPLTTSRPLTSFSWFECAPGLSPEVARCRRGPWRNALGAPRAECSRNPPECRGGGVEAVRDSDRGLASILGLRLRIGCGVLQSWSALWECQ